MENCLVYINSLSSLFPLSFHSKLHFLSRNPYKISSSLPSSSSSSTPTTSLATTRRVFSALAATSPLLFSYSPIPSSNASALSNFFELEGAGGVKALDLRKGDGEVPVNGDQGLCPNSALVGERWTEIGALDGALVTKQC